MYIYVHICMYTIFVMRIHSTILTGLFHHGSNGTVKLSDDFVKCCSISESICSKYAAKGKSPYV